MVISGYGIGWYTFDGFGEASADCESTANVTERLVAQLKASTYQLPTVTVFVFTYKLGTIGSVVSKYESAVRRQFASSVPGLLAKAKAGALNNSSYESWLIAQLKGAIKIAEPSKASLVIDKINSMGKWPELGRQLRLASTSVLTSLLTCAEGATVTEQPKATVTKKKKAVATKKKTTAAAPEVEEVEPEPAGEAAGEAAGVVPPVGPAPLSVAQGGGAQLSAEQLRALRTTLTKRYERVSVPTLLEPQTRFELTRATAPATQRAGSKTPLLVGAAALAALMLVK